MAGKRKQDDALAALLETAPKAKLVDLIVRVAASRHDVRRECLDYLNRHTALSPSQKKQSESEKLLVLWAELASDLDELRQFVAKRAKSTGRCSGKPYCMSAREMAPIRAVFQETLFCQLLLQFSLPSNTSAGAILSSDS